MQLHSGTPKTLYIYRNNKYKINFSYVTKIKLPLVKLYGIVLALYLRATNSLESNNENDNEHPKMSVQMRNVK